MSRLIGWGYEGRSVDDLVTFARGLGAQTVVDVRLNPLSRKAGFSKRALSSLLAEAGIKYEHLPALGNPTENRAGFAHPGTDVAERAHERFRTEILSTKAAAAALATIGDLLDGGPVVLVCYEADPKCCHRSLVAEALEQSPVGV